MQLRWNELRLSQVSEKTWEILLLTIIGFLIVLTFYCLSQGITVVFMHLYYFPIILLAYHYHKKGVLFSTVLGLYYVSMVVYFQNSDVGEIISAIERFFTFIGVALVIAYLSLYLEKSKSEVLELSEFENSIISNAQVWLTVLNAKGNIIVWNKAAENISGYKSEEVIGKNAIWKHLYPDPDYRKNVTNIITRIIKENNYFEHFNTIIVAKNSEKKSISWNTRALPVKSDIIDHNFVAIGIDISERKQAEEAVQESERRLADIINFLPDATLVIDRQGKVIAWNRAIEEMTGINSDEMLGKGNYEYALPFYGSRRPILIDMIFESDEKIRKQYYQIVHKVGSVLIAETELPRPKGKEVVLWGKASPLYNNKGEIIGAIESIRDITERKKGEEALKKARDELEIRVRERTAELQQTNVMLNIEMEEHKKDEERIKRSLDEKTVLLREIHHRVKNNLQVIISLINLQTRQISDENVKRMMQESQNRVKVMALVHEKLYRSEDISHINLSEYIRNLITILLHFYALNPKLITVKVEMKNITVTIDTSIPIGLIINELVSNSLKHAFPNDRKGEITLTIQRENDILFIIFKDNGIGISKDLDWQNTESLGLRLVISLVEQLDGSIELDRQSGTAFHITLHERNS